MRDDTSKVIGAAFPYAPSPEIAAAFVSHLAADPRLPIAAGAVGACWLWRGQRSKRYRLTAYARFRRGPIGDYVHRLAFEWATGVPLGKRETADLTVDHLCRRKCCANPAHLERVTRAENTMRGESQAARNARKTHCKRGHLLSRSNIYASTGVHRARRCKTCMRAWLEARRRREGARPRLPGIATHSKLTSEQVTEIRGRLAAGARHRALAALYGVSKSAITWINTGQSRR